MLVNSTRRQSVGRLGRLGAECRRSAGIHDGAGAKEQAARLLRPDGRCAAHCGAGGDCGRQSSGRGGGSAGRLSDDVVFD